MFSLIPTLAVVFGIELALRVQQAVGPFYELATPPDASNLSTNLNHLKAPGKHVRTLVPESVYGTHTGISIEDEYDDRGIRINRLRPNEIKDGSVVLFLGDSFMEGYGEENTLPHIAYDYVSTNMGTNWQAVFINTGISSYSPSIFVPLLNSLLPEIEPDIVVVAIDETDLGDDYFRYRNLCHTNEQGRIVAVDVSPPNKYFYDGFEHALSSPFYIVRLIRKLHHTRVASKAFTARYRAETKFESPLNPARVSAEVAEKQYSEAIKNFRRTVTQLCELLASSDHAPAHALIFRHPHLGHLQPDANGRTWNHISRDVIKDVTSGFEIEFHDVEPDLKKVFGDRPADYYWPNDMHFNFKGIEMYGHLMGAALLRVFRDADEVQ
ncbi:MAG: hypothetical protein CMO80_09380 [Verrucomicrobiales bacterium]|nr:hypothetical protein [Verrucomicrobiales bacterium]